MADKEARELVRKLSKIVLELVGDLEDAADVSNENKYHDEMAVYDQAIAWLKRNPEK